MKSMCDVATEVLERLYSKHNRAAEKLTVLATPIN